MGVNRGVLWAPVVAGHGSHSNPGPPSSRPHEVEHEPASLTPGTMGGARMSPGWGQGLTGRPLSQVARNQPSQLKKEGEQLLPGRAEAKAKPLLKQPAYAGPGTASAAAGTPTTLAGYKTVSSGCATMWGCRTEKPRGLFPGLSLVRGLDLGAGCPAGTLLATPVPSPALSVSGSPGAELARRLLGSPVTTMIGFSNWASFYPGPREKPGSTVTCVTPQVNLTVLHWGIFCQIRVGFCCPVPWKWQ